MLTVCVHSNDEVIAHGLGLSELVGVAVMDHVVAGGSKHKWHGVTDGLQDAGGAYFKGVTNRGQSRQALGHCFVSTDGE